MPLKLAERSMAKDISNTHFLETLALKLVGRDGCVLFWFLLNEGQTCSILKREASVGFSASGYSVYGC